jgi:hypothetical protein
MSATQTVGTFRRYIDKDVKEAKLRLIGMSAPILEEYEAQGLAMTLRQLYYQLVARGKLENVKENYDQLGDAVSDGRMLGLLSWTAIEDRGRFLRGAETFGSPREAIKGVRERYRTDLWKKQLYRPEVWIEKDALVGVIESACDELSVNYFSCRGYGSQSELWRAGRRFASYVQRGQRPIVLHFGDHDPSGVHMTEDNSKRLAVFAGVEVQVVRIALNLDQIERYRPPPNAVKPKDSRTPSYIEQFGIETCWELDALRPEVLVDLVRSAVLKFRDAALWDVALAHEAEHKQALDDAIEELDL